MEENTLLLAELQYETGEVSARYTRILSDDGTKWVRHGLYRAYHRNGQLASEGHYVNGYEEGHWRDLFENGQIAAEGEYHLGKEQGVWRFWKADGNFQGETRYVDGVEEPAAK